MAASDYTIPVKVALPGGPGRYLYGWVRSLTPDARGNIRLRTGNGNYSTRSADSVIHEPAGFEIRPEQPIAREV